MWREDASGLSTAAVAFGQAHVRMVVEPWCDGAWDWIVWCPQGQVFDGRAPSKGDAEQEALLVALQVVSAWAEADGALEAVVAGWHEQLVHRHSS